jgi:hypothetical protein
MSALIVVFRIKPRWCHAICALGAPGKWGKTSPASRAPGRDCIDHTPAGCWRMPLMRVTQEEPRERLTPLKQKRHKFICFDEVVDGILDTERTSETGGRQLQSGAPVIGDYASWRPDRKPAAVFIKLPRQRMPLAAPAPPDAIMRQKIARPF